VAAEIPGKGEEEIVLLVEEADVVEMPADRDHLNHDTAIRGTPMAVIDIFQEDEATTAGIVGMEDASEGVRYQTTDLQEACRAAEVGAGAGALHQTIDGTTHEGHEAMGARDTTLPGSGPDLLAMTHIVPNDVAGTTATTATLPAARRLRQQTGGLLCLSADDTPYLEVGRPGAADVAPPCHLLARGVPRDQGVVDGVVLQMRDLGIDAPGIEVSTAQGAPSAVEVERGARMLIRAIRAVGGTAHQCPQRLGGDRGLRILHLINEQLSQLRSVPRVEYRREHGLLKYLDYSISFDCRLYLLHGLEFVNSDIWQLRRSQNKKTINGESYH
jgi:hypothetical protein